MNTRDKILTIADLYCSARKIAVTTVSSIIFKDSRGIPRLRAGKSMTISNFDKAILWFSENWPENLDWPDFIDRPAKRNISPAVSKSVSTEREERV